jgi:hypothetical protein
MKNKKSSHNLEAAASTEAAEIFTQVLDTPKRRRASKVVPGTLTDKACKAFEAFRATLSERLRTQISYITVIGAAKRSNNKIYVFADLRGAIRTFDLPIPEECREYVGTLDENHEFHISKKFNAKLKNPEAEIYPQSPYRTAGEILNFGGAYLIEQIAHKLGVVDDLRKVFPDDFNKILSVASFMISARRPSMRDITTWSQRFYHPHGDSLTDQRVSELFSKITPAQVKSYQALRLDRNPPKLILFYDGSTITSHSKKIEGALMGKSKDDPESPQVCIGLIVDQSSGEPLLYRITPGNIIDVVTLNTVLKEMEIVGIYESEVIMDRGFYSSKNISSLFIKNQHFVVGAKKNVGYIKAFTDSARPFLMDDLDLSFSEVHKVYHKTFTHGWVIPGTDEKDIRSLHVHIYRDLPRFQDELVAFTANLNAAIADWVSNGATSIKNSKLVKKYCDLAPSRNGLNSVPVKNKEKIRATTKDFGIFSLVSDVENDAVKALILYRNKDRIEKGFHFIKGWSGSNTTKVHSRDNLDSKIFVQCVGLTLKAHMTNVLKNSNLMKLYTPYRLIDTLNLIRRHCYPGKPPYYTEVTEKQRNQFLMFGVKPLDDKL